MVYVLLSTTLPFFSMYLLPSLFKVFSFSLSSLFFFCSRGVKSAEIKIDLIFSGLPSFLNFFLLLRIKISSCKLLMPTLRRQGLVPFFPILVAFVTVVSTPIYSVKSEVTFCMSFSSSDSSTLCKIRFSCLFSFSFCSATIYVVRCIKESLESSL